MPQLRRDPDLGTKDGQVCIFMSGALFDEIRFRQTESMNKTQREIFYLFI